MNEYPEPVARLLALGRPEFDRWLDYRGLGIGPEHVPDLVRLAGEPAMYETDEDRPEVYAPVHAWRALGQLRAESAVGPLVRTMQALQEYDDDWSTEELPEVFARIGPAALPSLEEALGDTANDVYVRAAIANGVKAIAKGHPEARDRCVAALTRQLEQPEQNEPDLNGFLLANLLDLKAVESAPVIERAFAADAIDPTIAGDWEDARWELGLRDTPPPRRNDVAEKSGLPWPPADDRPRSAKERAKSRRKEARKARKRNRKKKR